MMVVITPSDPREAPGFVGGYSGKVQLHGDTLVTRLNVAIHPSQAGTEQRRSVALQGDILTLTSPEQAYGQYGGVSRLEPSCGNASRIDQIAKAAMAVPFD